MILVGYCQQRFLQRFDVLQKVMVPEPLSYNHFRESTRQGHLSVCPTTLNCDVYDAVDICIQFDDILKPLNGKYLYSGILLSSLTFMHMLLLTCVEQVKELYQLSYDHFMAAQQQLQQLALFAAKAPELSTVSRTQWALEVKQMEHVVLRNRIALQIAHQAGPGNNLRVSFDFAYHPCFAVAVVKKS